MAAKAPVAMLHPPLLPLSASFLSRCACWRCMHDKPVTVSSLMMMPLRWAMPSARAEPAWPGPEATPDPPPHAGGRTDDG